MWPVHSVTILCSCYALLVHGYSGGAPILVCKTLVPQHLSESETDDSPYQILLNTLHITKDKMRDPPMVEIMINSPQGEKFKGFILQARCVANDSVIGRFEPEPGVYQMIDCAKDIEVCFNQ